MEVINFSLFFAIVIMILFIRIRYFSKIIVFEYEKALKFRKGKFVKVLFPGQHWINPVTSQVINFDTRPRFVSISGQEVLSSDGISLKTSIAANFIVKDPYLAYTKAENYLEALYLILQLSLRQIIGAEPIDIVLEKRNEFGKKLLEMSQNKVAEFGLSLIDVEIKDIMFPGNLKQIFAQVAKAKQEGLAALEKARGETAALRNLANAAKMVDQNPSLMQLRLLQTLGESSGNTLILNANNGEKSVIPIKRDS